MQHPSHRHQQRVHRRTQQYLGERGDAGDHLSLRADAGDEIEKAVIRCLTTNESIKLGEYFGFDVLIEKNPANSNIFLTGTPCVAVLQGELKYTSEVSLGNNIGNVRRIEKLASMTNRLEFVNTELRKNHVDDIEPVPTKLS